MCNSCFNTLHCIDPWHVFVLKYTFAVSKSAFSILCVTFFTLSHLIIYFGHPSSSLSLFLFLFLSLLSRLAKMTHVMCKVLYTSCSSRCIRAIWFGNGVAWSFLLVKCFIWNISCGKVALALCSGDFESRKCVKLTHVKPVQVTWSGNCV